STSRRTSAEEAPGAVRVSVSSATSTGFPPNRPPLTGPEAHAAFAAEALHIDDSLQGDRVAAVVRVESERSRGPGAQRALELVGGLDGDEGAHDLAAVERDLDPDAAGALRHGTPPRRGRRGPRPGAGRRPRGRTCRGAARRRSAPHPGRPARRGRRGCPGPRR